jgi:hypothetical protein
MELGPWPGPKKYTKEERHGLIAAADPNQLRLELAKMDHILPARASNTYVRAFACKVADRAFDNIKYIDARGSYPNWGDPSRWIPTKGWKDNEKTIKDSPIMGECDNYETDRAFLEPKDLR